MSWFRPWSAAALLAAAVATAQSAQAAYIEQGDAGGSAAPQATIGSGPLGSIKGTIGELLPAAPGGTPQIDLVDAFTFFFVAAPNPLAPGLLLPAAFDILAEIGLPAVQFELRLLDELGAVLGSVTGDGSVRMQDFHFLPAVQKTTFHIEIAIGTAIDPPYTIDLRSDTGTIAPVIDVPEPVALSMLAAALVGLAALRRRRQG